MSQENEYRWEEDPSRAPELKDGDELLYCEHGRVIQKAFDNYAVDYRSHWFRVVKQYGSCYLLVRHGAGDERMKLSWSIGECTGILGALLSDNRYKLMHTLYRMNVEGRDEGANQAATSYQDAFVEGRLKKRKMPARGYTKVWIEARP